jgi:hypothetical protein
VWEPEGIDLPRGEQAAIQLPEFPGGSPIRTTSGSDTSSARARRASTLRLGFWRPLSTRCTYCSVRPAADASCACVRPRSWRCAARPSRASPRRRRHPPHAAPDPARVRPHRAAEPARTKPRREPRANPRRGGASPPRGRRRPFQPAEGAGGRGGLPRTPSPRSTPSPCATHGSSARWPRKPHAHARSPSACVRGGASSGGDDLRGHPMLFTTARSNIEVTRSVCF